VCKIARARRGNRHGFAGDFAHAVGCSRHYRVIARCRDRGARDRGANDRRPAACAKSPFDAVPAASASQGDFAHPCMGLFLSRGFYGTLIFFSLSFFLRQFLGSTDGRFFVPTCKAAVTPRAGAVKAGRPTGSSTRTGLYEAGLDGGEHGVTLKRSRAGSVCSELPALPLRIGQWIAQSFSAHPARQFAQRSEGSL